MGSNTRREILKQKNVWALLVALFCASLYIGAETVQRQSMKESIEAAKADAQAVAQHLPMDLSIPIGHSSISGKKLGSTVRSVVVPLVYTKEATRWFYFNENHPDYHSSLLKGEKFSFSYSKECLVPGRERETESYLRMDIP